MALVGACLHQLYSTKKWTERLFVASDGICPFIRKDPSVVFTGAGTCQLQTLGVEYAVDYTFTVRVSLRETAAHLQSLPTANAITRIICALLPTRTITQPPSFAQLVQRLGQCSQQQASTAQTLHHIITALPEDDQHLFVQGLKLPSHLSLPSSRQQLQLEGKPRYYRTAPILTLVLGRFEEINEASYESSPLDSHCIDLDTSQEPQTSGEDPTQPEPATQKSRRNSPREKKKPSALSSLLDSGVRLLKDVIQLDKCLPWWYVDQSLWTEHHRTTACQDLLRTSSRFTSIFYRIWEYLMALEEALLPEYKDEELACLWVDFMVQHIPLIKRKHNQSAEELLSLRAALQQFLPIIQWDPKDREEGEDDTATANKGTLSDSESSEDTDDPNFIPNSTQGGKRKGKQATQHQQKQQPRKKQKEDTPQVPTHIFPTKPLTVPLPDLPLSTGQTPLRYGLFLPMLGSILCAYEKITNSPPRFIMTCLSPLLQEREAHLLRYMQGKGAAWLNVPVIYFDATATKIAHVLSVGGVLLQHSNDWYADVQEVGGIPPCRALSMLSANSAAKVELTEHEVNRCMYGLLRHLLGTAKPKVVWLENAPRLCTPMGTPVKGRLAKIAARCNYSLHLWQTNALTTGLPQSRERTFASF